MKTRLPSEKKYISPSVRGPRSQTLLLLGSKVFYPPNICRWFRLHDPHSCTNFAATFKFSEGRAAVHSSELVRLVEIFWHPLMKHPLTVRRDEIPASPAVKGSLTDQWAQCEHAHLLYLFLKHNAHPLHLISRFPLPSIKSSLLYALLGKVGNVRQSSSAGQN